MTRMNESMDCTTFLRQIGKHEIAEYVERLRDNVAQLEVALIKSRRKIALQEATNRQILENYEPVRHGRWAHLGGDEWYCTACGEVIHTEGSWEKPTDKYCHECGVKMDGDTNGK